MRVFSFICLLGLIAALGCDTNTVNRNNVDINKATNTDQATIDQPDSDPTGTAAPATREEPAADNTAINERDRDSSAKTPLDQSEAPADREMTAKIRRRVVDLPDASVNARNVKIITAGGKVTLRGPVSSEDERDAIVTIAKDIAGDDAVQNQLEVAAK